MRPYASTLASIILAAAPLAAAGACAGGDVKEGLGPSDNAVAALSVAPAASSIEVGQVVLVYAEGRTAGGQPAPVVVDWSASGGSIVPVADSIAQFSAGAAGTYRILARELTASNLVDSTVITVVQPVSPTVSISLLPSTVSLSTGGTRQFSATAARLDGTTYSPSVVWSATGGTISANGLYTAGGTAGSFRVIAVQQGGTLADTSTVSITAPVLQAVILTPASVSLVTGGTQQFSVSGQWSNGATTAPAVTYAATGGTITAGGLYTAGGTPGTFRVIATQQGGILADTSSVLLSVPGANPHEPAGMTVAFDEAWNTTPNGRTGQQEWITDGDGSNFSVVSDPSAPASPSGVLQVLYPQGFGAGIAPAQAYFAESGHLPPNSGTLYMRFRIRVSSNWSDNGNAGTKFVFPRPHAGEGGGPGAQTNHVLMLTDHGSLDFGLTTQGPSDREYRSGANLPKGAWHDIEVVLTLGSSGSASDGSVQVWANGTPILAATGIKMLYNGQSASAGWRYLFLDPTYGGGTNRPPITMNFQLDHWYASVK